MGFNVNIGMKYCIRFRLIGLLFMGSLLAGCMQWPSFIIGDSSGYIQYDRNTRRLEVLWEKHIQVKDSIHHAAQSGSKMINNEHVSLSDK